MVTAHDPVAMENAARICPGLRYADTVSEAAAGADVVLHLTEWADYRAIDPVMLARGGRPAQHHRCPVRARRRALAVGRLVIPCPGATVTSAVARRRCCPGVASALRAMISVVIPAYNEGRVIGRLLDQLVTSAQSRRARRHRGRQRMY